MLIRLLYERIPKLAGISTQDIEITIFETPRYSWGIRGMPGDEIGLNYKVEVYADSGARYAVQTSVVAHLRY
jgi:hypothetical protein